MPSAALPLIDVEDLQLGMYVVLDVGWRSHPFAFSSFTVRTEQQLDQLRSMGLRRVRYCPERSIVVPAASAGNAATATPVPQASPTIRATAATRTPAVDAAAQDPLQRQQQALREVEAGFSDAATRHQQIMRQLLAHPADARRSVAQLGETMVRAVAHDGELAVRLLSPRVAQQPSGHEIATTALAMLLARECGFSLSALREMALAALLHDIGKLRIPSFLHEDHDRLTEFERGTYRRHVGFGVEMAEALDLAPSVLRAIGEHHERSDGSGFPAGLVGDRVSPAGRVLAIADRYQRLVCPLHADAGLTPHKALQQMYGPERRHFDPVYLPRFVRMMGIYPPGTLIELSDQRLAVVVASRPGMSLLPTVQVIDRPDDDEPSLAFDLDADAGPRVQCSVRLDQLNPHWARRARQLARSPIYFEPRARQAPVASSRDTAATTVAH